MSSNFPNEILPEPFCFYRQVLKSDHLHFGLWREIDDDIGFEAAQEQMFNHLLSRFPPAPARVIDVGCGLGLSAALLARSGYEVTAIDPSRELVAYARQKYGHLGVDFKEIGFLEEDPTIFPDEAYDVAFFQETMQFLQPLTEVFEKTRRILKDGGRLIMGDEVCHDPSTKTRTAVHPATDFVVAASESGFRILENTEVGGQVAPTCELVIGELNQNFDEIVRAIGRPDSEQSLRFYLDGWKQQRDWYSRGQMGYRILAARKDQFFVRAYSPGDEAKIIPMFEEIFLVKRTLPHWQWKYANDPFGSHKIVEAFSADGSLVGHFGAYPVPFHSSVSLAPSGTVLHAGDTMTKPAVRNSGRGTTGILARMVQYYYAKFCVGQIPFSFGFNTAVIRQLGMRYLDYKYGDTVTLWKRDLAQKPFGSLRLRQRLISGYRVERVHVLNAEWDDFFNRVCARYELLIRRDSEYLKWRYLDCPDKVHQLFAIRKRGILIGWSVFKLAEDKIIWGDALFDPDYPDAAEYLLGKVWQDEFPSCIAIEGWFARHPQWWASRLESSGFEPTREPNDLALAYLEFDRGVDESFHKRFYYTMGDSDLF